MASKHDLQRRFQLTQQGSYVANNWREDPAKKIVWPMEIGTPVGDGASASSEEFELPAHIARMDIESITGDQSPTVIPGRPTPIAPAIQERANRVSTTTEESPRPSSESARAAVQGTTTTGTTTSSPVGSPVSGRKPPLEESMLSRIEDNILDHYDAVTYHFRLFLMGENSNRTGGVIPFEDLDQITLAETGASTVGIDNVQIKTYGGMTKEAGSGVATTVSFELKQPFGVTFLDMILAAARALGIKDYTKAPYYLELTFRARDPETQQIIRGGPLEKLRWVWPLIITKTNIKVGIGGSEYLIEAVNMGDVGYSHQVADLKQVEAIPATTVGEFFEELKNRLEKQQQDFSVESKKDEYYFYIDENIAKERIIIDNQEVASQRTGPFEVSEDRKTITFNQNTSIDRIVDSILSMTKYFQKYGTGLKDPDNSNEPLEDREKLIAPELWKVISDVELLDYNAQRGDYNRRYKYLIISYPNPSIKTLTKVAENISSDEVVNVIRRKGVLKKLYNYVYTGQNDQVLDFDVNFNFNWYATLPYNAGIFGSGVTNGQPADAAGAEEGATPDAAAEQLQIEGNAAALEERSSLDILRDRFRENNLILTDSNGDIRFASIGEFENSTGNIEQGEGLRLAENSRNPRINIVSGQSTPASRARFSIDVDDIVLDLEAREQKDIPVAFREHGQARTENIAASGEHSRGKTFLSAVFEQATTPATADLLNIDIKVKGDPYWLEPAPIGSRQKPKNNIDVELQKRGMKIDNDGNLVGIDATDNEVPLPENFSTAATMAEQTFFGFRMFTPQEYDPVTGIMKQNSEGNLLNGLYGVIEVTHEFVDGKFTQNMRAVRMVDARMNASLFEKLANGEDITVTDTTG